MAEGGKLRPGKTSVKKSAAGFLRRMVSSDDVSKKTADRPIMPRAASMYSSGTKIVSRRPSMQKKIQYLHRKKASPESSLSVHEVLECPICFERFKQPKMLPCQHTFCLCCLESHQLSVESKAVSPRSTEILAFFCPICRDEVKLQRGEGLASLPSNLYIESLLRVVKADNEEKPSPCDACMISVTCHQCIHCHKNLCTVCWSEHLRELNNQLAQVTESLESARAELQQRREAFMAHCERVKENVVTNVQIKIQALKEVEHELTNEVARICLEHESSANELDERVQQHLAPALVEEEALNEADDAVKVIDRAPAIVCAIGNILRIQRTRTELVHSVRRWGEDRPDFDEGVMRISNPLPLEYRPPTRVPAVRLQTLPNGHLHSDALATYYKGRAMQIPRLKLNRGSAQRPGGLAVAPWASYTELYVAATDAHVVAVFDKRNGRLLRQLSNASTENNMLCPSGVTFCGVRSEIYVTDKWKHCVHVFARDGRYLRQLGTKGQEEGSFLGPEGLVCDPNEGVLYVCDTCNNRIQVINIEDGSYVRQLGTSSAVKHTQTYWRTEFNQPTGVAMHGDRVIVCDHGNQRIKIFHKSTGNKLLEFGSYGTARGQFRSPECVAVDKQGFVIVGDSGNGRVQIFRPSGQYVSSFGRYSWVSGIHVTPTFEIYVSDSRGHCVSVYS